MSILIRPRLTEFHGIDRSQEGLDFAIPFLQEDIPLYVDPFLLWKSPSLQDQALHNTVVDAFNHAGYMANKGRSVDSRELLVTASECREVGLGLSKGKQGRRIGEKKADEILGLFSGVEQYKAHGLSHIEEVQLFIGDISKDRLSDFTCTLLKSFLIDYTTQCAGEIGIPLINVEVPSVYDAKKRALVSEKAWLPVNPENGLPILFVPRRWLRFAPWISFEDYFRAYCPADENFNSEEYDEPAKVLRYNRENYDFVKGYVEQQERRQDQCKNDQLFKQIPVTSARRKLAEIKKLPSGKGGNADKKYEDAVVQLLASLFYPQLDFAAEQSRTDSGAQIRDLIFYNNRGVDFLQEIHADYGSRQLVFEMKNVAAIDRDHLNQLNRYLDSGLGKFGVIVTRNELSRAMVRNVVDLWSGQRRCIVVLTDQDLDLMVEIFESKQRIPLDVLKKKYIEFRRACPS